MGKPDFHKIYQSQLDAELTEGYWDGRRSDSPVPGHNRHPAYVHGFMNGRDDINETTRRTAEQSREAWRYIEAVFGENGSGD